MADLADAQYAAYIDRILECRKAEDAAKEDTRQAYADLKDAGGDKTEAGLLVRALRMDEKDAGKAKAREEMLEEARLRYRRGKASHVRAREATQSYAEAKGREKVTNGNLLATTPKANNPKASSAETGDLTTTPSELTDTQEQPESEQNTSVESRERQTAIEVSKPEATPKERSLPGVGPSGTAAPFTPSPETPLAIADEEAAPPAKSSAPIQSAADLLPGAVKAPEADSLPASGAHLSEADVPAFIRKTIADFRPNCLHPDMCAASGLRHCNACQKAMEAAEREVA